MLERRTFLTGLAGLPMVGGSVALVGHPTRAAVPVTDALHARYLAFLQHEHHAALREHERRSAIASWRPGPNNYEATAEAYAERCARHVRTPSWWVADAPDVAALVGAAPASSRAAVILSAAGVALTGGSHA